MRLSSSGEFLLRSVTQASLAGVAGVVVALVALSVDQLAGLRLPVPIANVRTLLGGVLGAVVTLAVFSLWMRSVVAGLVSSQVSPRIVSSYLDDDFQWQLLASMSGGLTLAATLLVSLPSADSGERGAPAVSTLLAVVVVLLGLVTLLVALRNAVKRMSLPEIVSSLADQAHAALQADGAPDDPRPDGHTITVVEEVVAADRGWVRAVDHRTILDALPEQATLVLKIGVGVFVSRGDVLAACDTELTERAPEVIRGAIHLEPARTPTHDLAFALQQLRDLAQRAMVQAVDTSTSHEVLLHLRTVLGRLIEQGVNTGHALGEDGRAVVSIARWSVEDHLREVLEPLVYAVGNDPVEMRFLVVVLDDLRLRAEDHGDHGSRRLLGDFADRLRSEARSIDGDVSLRPDGWASTEMGVPHGELHLDRPDRTE